MYVVCHTVAQQTIYKISSLCNGHMYNHNHAYGIAQMQCCTCSTTSCSLHARIQCLPSQVYKLATQKLLYTWFIPKTFIINHAIKAFIVVNTYHCGSSYLCFSKRKACIVLDHAKHHAPFVEIT